VGTTNSKPPGAIIVIGESKTGSTALHLPHFLVKEEFRMHGVVANYVGSNTCLLFLLHSSNIISWPGLLIGDNENFPINLDAFNY